jgi:hypothetical protein
MATWVIRLHRNAEEVTHMPVSKEFAVLLEDRPGTLGKMSRALAERGVNIVALQSALWEGKGLVRFVPDNPATARKALDNEGVSYKETDVAQAKLRHRSGELARLASRLGEASININYIYCGVDPSTYTPLLIFGVTDVGQAAAILDRTAAAA